MKPLISVLIENVTITVEQHQDRDQSAATDPLAAAFKDAQTAARERVDSFQFNGGSR